MKISALILGILGALGALGLGRLTYTAGDIVGYFAPQAHIAGFSLSQLQTLSIVIPIVGLVGSGLVFPLPKFAGLLMLMSGGGILLTLGFNTLSFVTVILLGIGGGLALFSPAGAPRSNVQGINANSRAG